jgi:ribosome recycling factor
MFDFSPFQQKLDKILAHTQQELATLRTGKANVQMLDPVRVEAYGSLMAVNELANVGTPDANMIVIEPWDKSILENIEKAIQKASLNLNPIVDGELIRIVISPLTEERRKELVKQLHQKAESAKIMMRNARIDIKNEVDDQEGKSEVSEDDIHRDLEQLDKVMDQYTEKLKALVTQKETDLLSI